MEENRNEETKATLKDKIDNVLEAVFDIRCIAGFMVGLLYMVIACGLTHGKTWKRIDE